MKILVAEDDRETAEFIRRGLRELGHNVILTDDGFDALHLLSIEQLDVAILDRMLPGSTAFRSSAAPERRELTCRSCC